MHILRCASSRTSFKGGAHTRALWWHNIAYIEGLFLANYSLIVC